MKTLKIVAISLLLTQLSALFGYDTFSDKHANIWVENGANSRSFYLPNWSKDAYFKEGNIIVNEQGVSKTDAMPRVFVNNLPTSYPAFSEFSFLPDISLVGLDAPSSGLGEILDKPTLSISPEGGDFNETVAITLQLHAPEDAIETIAYEVQGRSEVTTKLQGVDGNNTVTIYLSKAGEYRVTYKMKSDTDLKTATFRLSNSDLKRDSDGDGIPDNVEVELGLNPLSELQHIKGWTPFDIIIRNSDVSDSDGDGWSDFDEVVLRNTDPDDNRSKPTVDSLYGVEYRVATFSSLTSLYRVSFLDLLSSSLYESSRLQDINLSNEYHNVAISPLTNGELNSTLERGTIPDIRIPAKVPVIERVRVSDVNNTKVYKNFIASSADLSLQTYYEIFRKSEITEFTASDFIDSYLDYLSVNLVVNKEITLDDESSIDVSVLEAALRARVESNSLLFLGNPNFATPYEAYVNTQNALAQRDRSFNELFLDLQQLLSTYPLETPGLEDVMLLETNTSEANLASFMQKSLSTSDKYRISLMSIVDLKTADFNVSVLNLDNDSDKDALLNRDEVLAVNYSNPLLGDSDGDGIDDALDPCVNDIQNGCMNDTVTNEDSDGDGVVDSADNCPFNADSSQSDVDGDGIGDACSKKGLVITTPRTNLELFQDVSFTFKATKTEGSLEDVSWFIDGKRDPIATKDEYTHTFDELGKHEICASLKTTITDNATCVQVKALAKEPTLAELSLYTLSVIETDDGTKDALVEITLATPSEKQRGYTFETVDGSAIVASDYLQTTGTFSFNVGEQRKFITIPIVGDTVHETEEIFSLFVSATDTKEGKTAKIDVHIFDNDAAPDDNETEPPVTTAAQNNIFFAFKTEAEGSEPWMSDGSETNSTILKDIELDENSSYPRNFTKVGSDKLFFTASNADGAASLYVSDGTSDDTHSLGLLAGYEPSNFIDVNGTLFFTLLDAADSIKKLYKSDGESFNLITSLSRGYESTSMGNYFTLVGSDLYFSSDILSADEYDNELHRFNTTTEEITLVKDIVVGADSSYPSMLTKVDEALYFVAQNRAIYKTDGTEEGTILVSSLDENKSIAQLQYVNGSLHYIVNDYNLGTLDVSSFDLASSTQTTHLHYEDGTGVGLSFTLGDTYYITTSLGSEYKIISILGELVTEEFISDKYINQAKTLDDRFYILNSDGLICSSDYSTIMKSTVDGEYITLIEGSLNNELYFKVADKSTHSLYKADATTTTLLVDGGTAAP